jgi:dihydroorotate dehydrogenase (NAD+) catalytic subunit
MVDLSVQLATLHLRNPVLSASGTYGHGLEMQHFSAPSAMGGLVSKTVTLEPRPGNPAPRICETEAGFLNSIGLENHGVEHYIAHTLPHVRGADTCVITNIGGASVEDFVAIAERLEREEGIDALEVNLSCPNVQGGKLPFGTVPEMAAEVIARVGQVSSRPLFAKLSPNVTRISDMAVAVEAAGAAGITAVNTLLGMAVNWRTGKPGLSTVQGGYSGVGMKPVALRCAWECARAVSIPVIGCGGISCAEDVLEFLAAGCAAVQIGTASFSNPSLPGELEADLTRLLEAQGIDSLDQVLGCIRDGREPKLAASGGRAR